MGLSWWHLAVVLVIFVLLFGPGRISHLMGDLAKGLKSFNKAMAEGDEGEQSETKLIEHKRVVKRPSRRNSSRSESASRGKS